MRSFEHVVAFAELEGFMDLRLKNYSSGMMVRLAFATAIQVDADILLIDEVLAVGDAAFQQKCFEVFNRLRDQGRTIVFVTHDMGAVNRFCHRALLLERGDVVALGEPQEVADRYLALNFDREGAASAPDDGRQLAAEWAGSHEARILEAWTEDSSGRRQNACRQGERLMFRATVRFEAPLEDPAFTLELEDEWGTRMFLATTAAEHERSGHFAEGEEVVFGIEFENYLAPGKYYPTVNVSRRGSGADVIHRRRRMATITVFGSTARGGLVDFPYVASVERSAHQAELSRSRA